MDNAAASLLVPGGLWWSLRGPLSSQLLCHGPMAEQHAMQELGSEEKQAQGLNGPCLACIPQYTLFVLMTSH